MTQTLPNRDEFAHEIDLCFANLRANVPPEAVALRLRELESCIPDCNILHSRFLRARSLAVNRLGFGGEALGYLFEARQLIKDDADWRELIEIERAIALVQIWRGDVREAAFALLRAVSRATAARDQSAIALSFAEIGRLELEIGRPDEAVDFFRLALQIGDENIPPLERDRININLLQSLVASDRLDEATDKLKLIHATIGDAPSRLHFLLELETARIEKSGNDINAANQALGRARLIMPPSPDSFEGIEFSHAQSEVSIAEGDCATAERLLRDIITRYAVDDLAGREVKARLLQAKALDTLGRSDEAEHTLIAALRRAVARGLNGFADQARSEIIARGSVESAWRPGLSIWKDNNDDSEHRFVRRRPLGAGGFGTVSRAYDLELGIEIALKRVRLAEIFDTNVRRRLLDAAKTEIAATSRIDHPGVARIHGMLVDAKGDALIVQEFIEGPTLREFMTRQVNPKIALDLLGRIAFGLSAVHAAAVVHRDLKPDNIILRHGASPVIVDFGVALLSHVRAPSKVGTMGYMAPEQLHGRPVDARTDLYALGVIACELLLGQIPLQQPTLSYWSVVVEPWHQKHRQAELTSHGIDPGVAELIASLLSPHPYWRPKAAMQVGLRFSAMAV